MLHHPARVHAAAAFRRLHRVRWRWLRERTGLMPRFGEPPMRRGALPYLEAVWLPRWLIVFDAVSARGSGRIPTAVDACGGAFFVLDSEPPLHDDAEAAGDRFGPAIDAPAATAEARQRLLAYILRSPSRMGRPETRGVARCTLYHHPYWVYYFARARGAIDLSMLDAVTGDLAGHGLRAGFLRSLKTRHASDQASPAQ